MRKSIYGLKEASG
jgi:hypothetical protein